jgi:Mg-dependent DNase
LIAAEIARLHNRSLADVGKITTQNAVALFNLSNRLSTEN